MMKFKKALVFALSLIAVMGITACGNETINSSEQNTAEQRNDADEHFLEFLKGNEADVNGDTFWGVGEEDMEYALYDMNGDGVNELLVRAFGYWIADVIEYKDDKIQYANVENYGSSSKTFINDKNQFVCADTGHQGRAMYVVSKINEEGKPELVLSLVNYVDDWAESGSPEYYKKENPSQDYLDNIDKFDIVTEDEFNALVEEYSKESTEINWIKYN